MSTINLIQVDIAVDLLFFLTINFKTMQNMICITTIYNINFSALCLKYFLYATKNSITASAAAI